MPLDGEMREIPGSRGEKGLLNVGAMLSSCSAAAADAHIRPGARCPGCWGFDRQRVQDLALELEKAAARRESR